MRILHTSDWHLGASLLGAPRLDEQAAFLRWLEETMVAREIDLLLVAGDIFDQMHPGADAQSVYFSFLARCAKAAWPRQVVVVAGNHDSPLRMRAPDPVLRELKIHVSGGYDATNEARMIVPVRDHNGTVSLVVAAVPFIAEYRLGITGMDASEEALADSISGAFRALYQRCADLCAEHYPGVPMVATGHLTVARSDGRTEEAKERTELHQIGTIGALPSNIFDPRYAYVALGHIHRAYPISDDRVHYAGTPVPVSWSESGASRRVLVVDVDPQGDVTIERVSVPQARRLKTLAGTVDEVVAMIARTADLSEDLLPPYLRVVAQLEEAGLRCDHLFHDAVERLPEPRPRLIDISYTHPSVAGRDESAADTVEVRLQELTPEDVFRRLYRSRHDGAEAPASFLQAFRTLLVDEDDAS